MSLGGSNLSGPPILTDSLSYDIDWLLTDRREDRFWVGTGLTLRFSSATNGHHFDDTEIGANVKMGYRSGQWDYNLHFSSFTSDDSKAMAWMTYRF